VQLVVAHQQLRSIDASGEIAQHLPAQQVQTVLALLQRAGFAASLSAQIQCAIWYKLWGNMTLNPISAITGATTDII
jgi:ketopantoate reductase